MYCSAPVVLLIVRKCLLRCFPLLGILVGMDQKDSVAVGCGRARRRYRSGMSIVGILMTLLTLCFLRCRQAQMLCIMAGKDQKDSSQRHSFGFSRSLLLENVSYSAQCLVRQWTQYLRQFTELFLKRLAHCPRSSLLGSGTHHWLCWC